jgi:hypothetical protein
MRIRNTCLVQLHRARALTGRQFSHNIAFNRCEPANSKKTIWNVTLKVRDSSGPGHRLGYQIKKDGTRRNLSSACWHAHGVFMYELLKINGDTVIYSRGSRIDKDIGNWLTWQVGFHSGKPLYIGSLCYCRGEYIYADAKQGPVLSIKNIRELK